MLDKKQLTILIVIGVALFLFGAALGITFIQSGAKVQTANSLASKVISSIIAYGQVKSINGNSITLSNLGDDLIISAAKDAKVYSFTTVVGGAPVQKLVGFGNIKVGDKINVTMKLSPKGQLEGSLVVILPVTISK